MATLPQVQLSFGASNGAWDDRELIHACDAAMEEFHVSAQIPHIVLLICRRITQDLAHG